MVFSSIPVYVDPPNWHQQSNTHHQANVTDSPNLLPPLPPQAVSGALPAGGGVGSIRPGSMADRARLAKIPPPEAALKCPRCDSTNTKFCYFNNYSLSQPRHFCKTCRRYWTRGGALRNVPVGGGCRRNKKNKRSRSKSPANSEKPQLQNNPSGAMIPPSGAAAAAHDLIGHHQLPQPPNLPFMASLQNLSRFGVGNMDHLGFQIGGNSSSSAVASAGNMDQWRLQQFPFLNGFDSNSSSAAAAATSYPFQNDQGINEAAPSGLVKMEENGAMNLSRSNLNVSENNNQFYTSWNGDMSGLASSSTTHHLL